MATAPLEFDRQLIPAERYQQNLQELTDLVTHHAPRFQRIALSNLGNVADAEDAVQDAVLAALTHVDRFRGEAKMSTWLTAIVINSTRMNLRRRSRQLQIVLEESVDERNLPLVDFAPDTRPSPEEIYQEREIGEIIGNATSQLSPALLRAFQLRHVYGLNIRETASLLGVPSGTVKARTARARNKLKKLLSGTLGPWLEVGRVQICAVSPERKQDRRRSNNFVPWLVRGKAIQRKRAAQLASPHLAKGLEKVPLSFRLCGFWPQVDGRGSTTC